MPKSYLPGHPNEVCYRLFVTRDSVFFVVPYKTPFPGCSYSMTRNPYVVLQYGIRERRSDYSLRTFAGLGRLSQQHLRKNTVLGRSAVGQ
jgi:hypothetical protein